MEADKINLKKWNKTATIKGNKINFKKIVYKLIILILLNSLNFFFFWIRNIKNTKKIIKNEINTNDNVCIGIKNKIIKRTQPLDFENELLFFTDLIMCKIPFSFIRFGDGENSIMKGDKFNASKDNWYWKNKNKEFQNSLIESSSICTNLNSFIGIPCKNWISISKSILSFSKCSSAKYMSYATLFINKNYPLFKKWILQFINTSNRWKIILVANSIINKDIRWAYKFFPVPDHLIENWEKYKISLLPKLSNQAKENHLIFFISAGPAANIIVSHLTKINNKNIYIDFGSSIEFITKGYTTRAYAKNGKTSYESCEPFFIQDKSLIYTR
jgi:hypothetical protein